MNKKGYIKPAIAEMVLERLCSLTGASVMEKDADGNKQRIDQFDIYDKNNPKNPGIWDDHSKWGDD